MPASLFHIDSTDPAASPGCLEDQRALQLALELSMLGLSSDSDPLSGSFDPDARGKKSQNTTECVPVPSSEHVAEIVGRQGKFCLVFPLFSLLSSLLFLAGSFLLTPPAAWHLFVFPRFLRDTGTGIRLLSTRKEHWSPFSFVLAPLSPSAPLLFSLLSSSFLSFSLFP